MLYFQSGKNGGIRICGEPKEANGIKDQIIAEVFWQEYLFPAPLIESSTSED